MSEEKLLILKMLENGTISFEEAVALIDAIDEDASDIKVNLHKSDSSKDTNDASDFIADESSKKRANSDKTTYSYEFDMSNLEKTLKKLGKTFEQLGDKFEVKMDGLGDEVEKTINNNASSIIGDFKNLFGTSIYNSYSTEFKLKYNIKEPIDISISTLNGKIVVVNSDDDNLYFTANFYSRKAIEDFDASKFCDYSFENNSFNFDLFKKVCNGADIKISIPKNLVSNIKLLSSNAKIVCEDILCSKLDASTSNAKIILSNCNIVNGNLKTSNGKINLDSFDISKLDSLDIVTSNAKILATFKNDILRPGIIDLNTSNGKIDCDIPNFINESDISGRSYVAKSAGLDLNKPYFNLKAVTSNAGIYFE